MRNERLRVLMTCRSFEPGYRAGGPIRTLARIVDTVSPQIELTVLTSDRDLGATEAYPGLSGAWKRRGHAAVHYLNIRSVRQWAMVVRRIRKRQLDVLYCNSLWDSVFTVIPVLAARLGLISVKTILMAPRGELSPGALAIKPRKKRAFLSLWRRVLNHRAIIWHASTQMEADDIRRLWPQANMEVVEDQTDLPAEPIAATAKSVGVVRLVFISRISQMKNLDLVLRALRQISTPMNLDIYGPLEDASYWESCQEMMSKLPDHLKVRYRGVLQPDRVRYTFAEYDSFVFPTRGENFGHVIAESLSASCPIICSDQTPWTSVLLSGGGEVLAEITESALAERLRHLAERSPAQQLAAHQRAGAAYREWRASVADENVLGRLLISSPRTDPARSG